MFQIWKKSDATQIVILCKEENVKKIKQFSGTNISRSYEAISFNFDMWNSVAMCKAEDI